MSSTHGEPAAVTRDDQLAQLLAEMAEQTALGHVADVESIAREHPDLGGRAARVVGDRPDRRRSRPDP